MSEKKHIGLLYKGNLEGEQEVASWNDSDGNQVITLRNVNKLQEFYTEKGLNNITELYDHGNGFIITLNGREIELDYSEAGDLYTILRLTNHLIPTFGLEIVEMKKL